MYYYHRVTLEEMKFISNKYNQNKKYVSQYVLFLPANKCEKRSESFGICATLTGKLIN